MLNGDQEPRRQAAAANNDIVGDVLGDFGIYQLRTILIVFLCKIPAAWFMACIIFTAPELYPNTEFTCNVGAQLPANQTVASDQCVIETTRAPCTSFEYRASFYSLIMQFDLVCERDILIAWTQFWHLFGVLVGGVAATTLMQRLSPRRVYITGMLAQLVCGVVTGYAPYFNLHTAFRCLSAVCCAIMFTAGQSIMCDITAGKCRTGVIILYDTFWSIGVILLPGLAWFFSSWSHIYLAITFPTLLLCYLLRWTPDAPRWLLQRRGDARAIAQVAQLLRKAAALNDRRHKLPANLQQQLTLLAAQLQAPPAVTVTWTSLWQGRRAKTHMLAAHLALAGYIINFMGMLLNIRSFGRDFLVPNTIIMGFAEIFGCFMALHFTMTHSKWKWQCAGAFNILAGIIGCLGWSFTHNHSLPVLVKLTLWMTIAAIPKAAVSCAQSMLLACMGELVPAPKRTLFTYSVVTWARVWLLSAPFFNVLKRIDTALSLSMYSIFSIIAGIATCFLLTPRNLNIVMPQTNGAKEADPTALRSPVWTVDADRRDTHL